MAGREHRGWQRRVMGRCQAWYYPRELLLLLWEAYLDDRYRAGADPLADPAARLVWARFERSLLAQCPGAGWVATTWEDAYPRAARQRCLAARGYEPGDSRRLPAVFMKRVADGR